MQQVYLFKRPVFILLIQVVTGMLMIHSTALAQTADSTAVDKNLLPADTAEAMSPLKKLVSEVAQTLFKQHQYVTLTFVTKPVRCTIKKDASLYKLPGGESRAVLLELPVYEADYHLSIRSMAHGIGYRFHVFAPQGVFLDSSFKPIHLLPANQFRLVSYGSFNEPGLSAKILMSNERRLDRYLLIYTMRSGEQLSTYINPDSFLNLIPEHPVTASANGKLDIRLHL